MPNWNTSINYITSSPFNFGVMNGVGNDLRVWGGPVDAGGNTLANLASVTFSGAVSTGIVLNGASGAYVQLKSAGVSKGFIGYAPLGAGGIAVLDAAGSGSPLLFIDGTGKVGIGTVTPMRSLHVANVPTGGGLAVSGSAPQIALSSADTDPNGNAMSLLVVMATAPGHYGLPAAGDISIMNSGASHGNLYINANYQLGTKNIILVSQVQLQTVPTYASNATASTGLGGAGRIYSDGSGNLKVTY